MLGGDLDKGLKLLNEVVSMEPSNERNYVKRYRVYVRKRKFKEAFADLTTALSLKPSYKAALAPRAKLGLQLGRCAEAAADLAQLRQIDPKASELRNEGAAQECAVALTRAAKLEAKGDWPGARDALGIALAHADSSADGGGAMRRAERVIFAFATFGKARKSAAFA